MSERDEESTGFDWALVPQSPSDPAAPVGEPVEVPVVAAPASVPPNTPSTVRVPAGAAGFTGVGEPVSQERSSRVRIIGWVTGGLVALAAVVGIAVALTLGPTLSAAPSATSTPTAPLTPTAPAPLGVAAWDRLFGGECLNPFDGPWSESFTVVDCASEHAAQLVWRGSYSGDAAPAEYPGDAELAKTINALCTQDGIFDLSALAGSSQLQVQGSYPATAEQWAAGDRSYYCFVSNRDGSSLTGSVAGPGPK